MSKTKNRRPRNTNPAEDKLLKILNPNSGTKLSQKDKDNLILMLAMKSNPEALEINRLVPKGSYLARVTRHFQDTDIPFALPVFQTVMMAASWLTQNGAFLDVPGLGKVRPTLWTIALLESGSSKTLATSRIASILNNNQGAVRMLPEPGSDAQWIQDLANNNGAFWLQDEVGKFCAKMLNDRIFSRIKPWLLSAYSHQTISNRLKGEAAKLEIGDPHFTFFGLSVLSTWQSDVDAVSMLDGFCQRMNYVLANPRRDTDLFDHFLYFEGEGVAVREADLKELWQALCAQPGVTGPYRLAPEVLSYLKDWWAGLRKTWGATGVPGSFMRRIGYSVLRYLTVLHFLLGKSRHPVDLETAALATHFAEYHFESTRMMLVAYDQGTANRVRRILEIRKDLSHRGQDLSNRNISRRLGKSMREGVTSEIIEAISEALDKVDVGTPFDSTVEGRRGKSAVIAERHNALEAQLSLTERKRNERRLRNLRKAFRLANNLTAFAHGQDASQDEIFPDWFTSNEVSDFNNYTNTVEETVVPFPFTRPTG